MKSFQFLLIIMVLSIGYAEGQVAIDSTQQSEEMEGEPEKALPQSTTQPPQYADDIVVEANQLPDSVRTTLQSKDYTGWENGKIYFNKKRNEYIVEIKEGNQRKAYRFDKNGKRIDLPK